MSRLRRRDLIPEDTPIVGVLAEPKLVSGQWGRQVQASALVTEGEYRGTKFPVWFGFAKDEIDGEEIETVSYGGALYQAFAGVRSDIDEVLDREDLTEREYQAFVKDCVKKLDGFKFMARADIKTPKDKDGNPKKDKNSQVIRRQIIQPGSFGPYIDPEEGFDELDMSKAS